MLFELNMDKRCLMTLTGWKLSRKQVGHFYKADSAYGEGVAMGLGLPVPKAA